MKELTFLQLENGKNNLIKLKNNLIKRFKKKAERKQIETIIGMKKLSFMVKRCKKLI